MESSARGSGGADVGIEALAERQHGVVTRAQLLDLGLTRRMVQTRIGSGRLVPLHRGVYRLGALRGRLEPQRAREMAAMLACGPHSALSHRSAGWLHGLGPRPRSVEVTVPAGVRREREGIRVRRSRDLTAEVVQVVDGLRVTTPLRTLRDLAAVVGAGELERAAARGERAGLVLASELATLSSGGAGRPGAALLRSMGDDPGSWAFTRSEAEEVCQALLREGGLPSPRTNVLVAGHEVDFYWENLRLAVEVDGYRFHGSRRSFEHDRRRDGDLAAAGVRVVRVTWRQLTAERDRTLVRIAQALARGGR